LLVEPAAHATVGPDLEGRRDLGALRTVAHGAAVGSSADREQQRIHQDRLPGAGLAGEYGESGPELDLHGLDDREIANLQVAEHGAAQATGGWASRTPRPQCSFERSIR